MRWATGEVPLTRRPTERPSGRWRRARRPPGGRLPWQLFASGSRSLASTRGTVAALSRHVNRTPYRRSKMIYGYACRRSLSWSLERYSIVKLPKSQDLLSVYSGPHLEDQGNHTSSSSPHKSKSKPQSSFSSDKLFIVSESRT